MSTLESDMGEEYYEGKRSWTYTGVDYAYLAVAAVISGIIFYAAWYVYSAAETAFGPIGTRMVTYGLWFIGAPLGATLVRKPGSAFLGETLGALVETFLPTPGSFTNLIYGAVQGLLSEAVYLITGYRRFDPVIGGIAGAAAAPGAIFLDSILFQEIASPPVMLAWIIAAAIGGFVYGFVVSGAAKIVRG